MRCLHILKLLAEEPLHVSELAILFDVSERAIQRDILTLKEAGAVIDSSGRGYHLRGRCRMPF
ncbi:MAG: helix-turn-helix domain-containing protein [Candidatus Eremiobacteraeota bacterium]|nr:helix-turn-helix domain-containing protein [Candidatus Eremiobacteraeota bacterium]MCW5869245.1 helix-turn-helix domain-containing protein [Candidatus Eremiobacteraeota bacterium]